MDEVTIEYFRCFQERQTARLAPLTLLVGQNSTGKTSLMAMIRILWHAVFLGDQRPSFKDEPFDLGSFREVVHQSRKDDGPDQEFSAGIAVGDFKSDVKFRKGGVGPEVRRLQMKNAVAAATWALSPDGHATAEVKTSNGSWHIDADAPDILGPGLTHFMRQENWGGFSLLSHLNANPSPVRGALPLTTGDKLALQGLILEPFFAIANRYSEKDLKVQPPVATAPVRSRPRRTHDPGPGSLDPEGAGVPEHLAALSYSDAEQWKILKRAIESCGQRAGVFDEIDIRPLGDDSSSDPFQIQVRTNTRDNEEQWRNLIDVGYGVSQILPVILELARPVESYMLILQQPEVHLHPSAQAGLGSMLCEVAATKRQILVETHSDHLIDRVRMDVRDRVSGLKPEDVSILYFERETDGVRIHNIRIDNDGNIVDQPPSYREFFRQELNRSLGI